MMFKLDSQIITLKKRKEYYAGLLLGLSELINKSYKNKLVVKYLYEFKNHTNKVCFIRAMMRKTSCMGR